MLPRLALSFVNALALLGVVAANLATKEMRGVYCPEGGQPSCCSKIINKDSYEGQVLARRYGVRLPFDEFIGSSCSPLLYTRSGVKWCPSGTLVSCCSGPYYGLSRWLRVEDQFGLALIEFVSSEASEIVFTVHIPKGTLESQRNRGFVPMVI
ncbi:hypothetical protein BKA61DRAFT_570267 [Leptodontidium sp. MPI-SDFR-AT-0119]|nr:hypothetical protein BKA61DRAFT_570267 [Leptodontidium sp. MPI-SDFR-AT-0119]